MQLKGGAMAISSCRGKRLRFVNFLLMVNGKAALTEIILQCIHNVTPETG